MIWNSATHWLISSSRGQKCWRFSHAQVAALGMTIGDTSSSCRCAYCSPMYDLRVII